MSSDITPPEPTGTEPPAAPDPKDMLWSGLQNLDTRAETLDRTLIPGQDLPPGMTWQQVRADAFARYQESLAAEQPADPLEQFYQPPAEQQLLGYDHQGQPIFGDPAQFQQPESPPVDPRDLADAIEQRLMAKWEAQQHDAQTKQAFDNSLAQGVQEAAAQFKLSDIERSAVEQMARSMAPQRPNVAPAELAKEMAQQLVSAANARFVQNGGVIPPQGEVPSGPIPADQKPKTFAELGEFMRQPGVLNP